MLRRFVFGLTLIVAAPVQALTCMAPDVAQTFQVADESSSSYVVALGALRRTGENVMDGEDTGDPNNRVGYSFTAQFDGQFATSGGFETDRSVPVTVEVQCLSAWCGGEALSDDGLYFFRRDAQGQFVLQSGPCPRYFFDAPQEHQLTTVIDMMR